jgi:signal transduction histidine kinase
VNVKSEWDNNPKLRHELHEGEAHRPGSACLWRWLVAGWLFSLPSAGSAQTNLPTAPLLLTNLTQIWAVTGEAAQQPQRIRAEAVILFYDVDWTAAFGVCDGKFTYLPIATSKVPLQSGQRILLDGWVTPTREVFYWDRTQIKVLEENVPLPVTSVTSLSSNALQISGQLVSVEGLIDQDRVADANHLVLALLVNGENATVNVHLHTANQAAAFTRGDFVRLKCLYIPTFDRDDNISDMTLWVDGVENVEKIGSIANDPRFAIPSISTSEFDKASRRQLIRVAGMVHGYEPGKWVTIWDDTGQVMIQSAQTQPLRVGDRIEAIGYPDAIAVRNYLHGATYRMADTNGMALSPGATSNATLYLAAQIQSLGPEEVKRHPPVKLRAILVWTEAATPFIYVQDASGCVRVVNPKFVDTNIYMSDGTILNILGEATAGAYVPVVTNAVITRSGWTPPDPPDFINLDQALSGAAEGRFVEMRAFVRSASMGQSLNLLHLSTSQGEFQAWVPNNGPSAPWIGAVVRIRGICSATSNDRHQLTGVELWVPSVAAIQIEEEAPHDLFASPLLSLGNLRRFNSQSYVNQRVRTVGTVVLQEPGRYLYVQDGTDSIFALSQQKDLLKPGDRVEVVGFPGNEGRRFLLREAVFRRIDKGVDPIPVSLPDRHLVNPDLEGLLARSNGRLLDAVQKDGQARFLIQSAGYAFEGRLDSVSMLSAVKLINLPLNSKLELTGVYEVQSDEYGHPASFSLHLRSWDDAVLLARAPWWTSSRLFVLLLIVVVGTVVAVAWGLFISHRNTLLRRTQEELKLSNAQLEDRVLLRTGELREQVKVKEQALSDLALSNAQLEDRVLSRTAELREQVEVKEQALSDLAQAQQRLMLASRQAGMAEVATSVLHNVGNVLNSVNVSTSCLRDRVQHLRVELVGKTASLLSQPDGQLAIFLKEDARGRKVPGFLTELGENLLQGKLELTNEIESLAKSVEHINAIVSMQQNHAKLSGILEELDVKTIVEDAIEMNSVAYKRHAIELVRDFQPVPPILVDRHKVLQILINLLANAKYALESRSSGKRVTVCILAPRPGWVRISATDNGCGIAKENLDRIFSQGFTTRKNGHGFGLHNGALSARELGGSLVVRSAGPGQGATFALEFPARP